MKNFLLLLSIWCTIQLQAQVGMKTTRKDMLARQDLVFDSLSTKWEEGAFLGNGLLGIMVYREDARSIRFDLGRTDVVDHREGINPSIGRARLPIGRFVLRTSYDLTKVHLRLDLWNAELSGTLETPKGKINLQALVPATRDVILIRTSGPASDMVSLEWMPEPAVSPFLSLGRDSMSKYKPNPPAVRTTEKDIAFHYQPLLAGGGYTTAWKHGKEQGKQSWMITIASSYPADVSKQQAANNLAGMNAGNLEALVTAHRDHWHRFFEKSFISIPDKKLESFWFIQQYKMASATRPGAYPIDLMGPWYKQTPWPKYWWNLNIQLTYYPLFSSNHLDLVQPLLKMVNGHIDNLSRNAPQPYQYNAAALSRSGPYDMVAPLKVLKGNDSTGNSAASLELGNLTWLLHVCWQAYEYSMDPQVMKAIYPVLTRAINYYLDIATREADGKYHLPYTYSPEYPKGITRDANYDLSVLRWGLKTLLYINHQLRLRDALQSKWQDLLDDLVPYPRDAYGLRIGRDASFTLSHRHYSHLLMVYPIYDLNWDQPENRDLIRRSLEQWENNNEAWRGYSYTGSGSIHAMMGEGDSTWKLLNEMMKGRFSIKPNTMYLEAGPVIETPLSAVTTLNEMLLQSWGGVLRVFPALPASWKDVSFDKLLARGAFEVSASGKEGRTLFIRIKSLAGSPCLVKTGWTGEVKAIGKRAFKVSRKGNDLLSIDLKKGEEVILFTGQKPTSFTIDAVASGDNQHYWGLMNKENE